MHIPLLLSNEWLNSSAPLKSGNGDMSRRGQVQRFTYPPPNGILRSFLELNFHISHLLSKYNTPKIHTIFQHSKNNYIWNNYENIFTMNQPSFNLDESSPSSTTRKSVQRFLSAWHANLCVWKFEVFTWTSARSYFSISS